MTSSSLLRAAATGIIILLTAAPRLAASTLADGRITLSADDLRPGHSTLLNGEWNFRPGYDVGPGESPESAETTSTWLKVNVPQFLNRVQWWLDDSEDFKKHEDARLSRLGFDTNRSDDGWHRLELDVPAPAPGQHLFIEFDGVAMRSRAYCNGALLGEHAGMFSRFGYDLTPHLRPGKNVLAVYVSMERIPVSALSMGQAVSVNLTASKVKSMSKGMFGPMVPDQNNRSYDLYGIWQPVRLVARNDAMIHDVFFVPSLTGAQVSVEASSLGTTAPARLKAVWRDRATDKVFASAPAQEVSLVKETGLTTLTLSDVHPRLWTPAEPNLYRLEVTLESPDGKVLDRWSDNVGFRTFEARGNQLFLNGKPYWLRGANQLPYGKNPWDPELARKLIRQLHDSNVRVTRTHATPWNEDWLDAADEIGLGISVEGIRPWAFAGRIGATPPDLFKHWLMENEDVVRRCRNHPSVLLWTVGNEMLLRDSENLEKWQQLSEIVRQTRAVDPMRPVICYSSYEREPKLYDSLLKPNNIDDGDIDALHSYKGWYSGSPFVDAQIRSKKSGASDKSDRPLIGQEFSAGYPDLDTGLPVLRYTDKMLTPQAWVGIDAYPGSDPAVFLEHVRAVCKRWGEQLRFSRAGQSSGALLFSCECWFHHSYDAATVSPYSVFDGVRDAWAPIGLALETGLRRFTAGEPLSTAVYVTSDEENGNDLSDLELRADWVDRSTSAVVSSEKLGTIDKLAYFETKKIPARLTAPTIKSARQELDLVLRLLQNGKEISRGTDRVEVFARPQAQATPLAPSALVESLGPEFKALIERERLFGAFASSKDDAAATTSSVILLGPGASLDGLTTSGQIRDLIAKGATCILFSPDTGTSKSKAKVSELQNMFPGYIAGARADVGEFADVAPAEGTALAAGLKRTDLKWWGRKDDWRVFVADRAHRLAPGGSARDLVRFIPAHGYIPESKVPDQFMSVLFEIPIGQGRLWVCDLDLESSVGVDPAARLFAINLLRAAADPTSTKNLRTPMSHEELLKRRR